MTVWDSHAVATRREHDQMDFPDARVYNFSGSLNSNTGETDWTRAEDANSPVTAEVTYPRRPQRSQSATGDDASVDAEIRIRDDTGVALTPVGEDDSKPTVIEYNGTEFTVVETYDEGNGLTRIDGVER